MYIRQYASADYLKRKTKNINETDNAWRDDNLQMLEKLFHQHGVYVLPANVFGNTKTEDNLSKLGTYSAFQSTADQYIVLPECSVSCTEAPLCPSEVSGAE